MKIAHEGFLPAGKGEERQRHRNGNINAHLADIHFALIAPGCRTGGRKDGGAVAIGAAVNQCQRFIQIGDLHTAQDWPKNFLPVNAHVGAHIAEQRWAEPVTVRVTANLAISAVQQQCCTVFHSAGNQRFYPLFGIATDQRAITGLGVVPVAGANTGQFVAQFVYPVNRLAHKHRHADRHATLSGGAHRRAQQIIDNDVFVGVGHDDHVVFGARHTLHALECVTGTAVNMFTHGHRADK